MLKIAPATKAAMDGAAGGNSVQGCPSAVVRAPDVAAALAKMPPEFQAEYAAAEAAGWVRPPGHPYAGKPWYPPNDGATGPPELTTIDPPAKLDRVGEETGSYLSPAGASFEERALPERKPLKNYTVTAPVTVEKAIIAPWFGQPGGGTQYRMCRPDPEPDPLTGEMKRPSVSVNTQKLEGKMVDDK